MAEIREQLEKITLKEKKKKAQERQLQISFSRWPWNLQPQVTAEMRDLQKQAKPKSERECMRISKDQWKWTQVGAKEITHNHRDSLLSSHTTVARIPGALPSIFSSHFPNGVFHSEFSPAAVGMRSTARSHLPYVALK